jgi:hypothetical protein
LGKLWKVFLLIFFLQCALARKMWTVGLVDGVMVAIALLSQVLALLSLLSKLYSVQLSLTAFENISRHRSSVKGM